MYQGRRLEGPPVSWGEIGRALVWTVAFLGVVLWLFVAYVLAAVRCDDSCAEGQADSWTYTGQLVLAGAGALLFAVALGLAFTPRTRASWTAAATAVGCGLVWLVWFLQGGF